MTGPVNSRAARAAQEPAEAEQHDDSHHSLRTGLSERALAALEALLTRELEQSPSIAGPDVEHEQPYDGAEPLPRRTPPAEIRRGRRLEDFLAEVKDLAAAESARAADAETLKLHFGRDRVYDNGLARDAADDSDPGGWRTRALKPEPVPWLERPERASLMNRAMRVAAAVFSVVAVVGITAVVAALVVGGELPAKVTALIAAPAEQSAGAASNAPAPAQRADAPTVTGALGGKQDTSRILSDDPVPVRTVRTVRAVAPQPPAAETQTSAADTQATAVETQAAATSGDPSSRANAQAALDSRGSLSSGEPKARPEGGNERTESAAASGPARSYAEPAAPTAPAVAETEKAKAPEAAAPARAARSVSVTEHVNMRASAKGDAAVVGVVPAGKNVELVSCAQWCEVVYDGKKGFVYKKFLSGMGG